MNFSIEINDTNLANLSSGAKSKLQEQVEEYANDLLKEAALIEEGDRQEGANSEITSNIIMQAVSVRRNRNFIEKKTPVWIKICKFVSTISCLITGFIFDPTGYQDNFMGFMTFVVCFAMACISTALIFIKEK